MLYRQHEARAFRVARTVMQIPVAARLGMTHPFPIGARGPARDRTDASLFLGGFGGFASGFLFVRGAVKAFSRAFRHRAHDFPRRLVIDREEAVGAFESLLHLRRKAVVVETAEH